MPVLHRHCLKDLAYHVPKVHLLKQQFYVLQFYHLTFQWRWVMVRPTSNLHQSPLEQIRHVQIKNHNQGESWLLRIFEQFPKFYEYLNKFQWRLLLLNPMPHLPVLHAYCQCHHLHKLQPMEYPDHGRHE